MSKIIFLEFHKIGSLMHRALMNKKNNNSQRQSEATHLQMCIMGFLHDCQNADIFQRDIEKQFCIRRSTASQILNNLESKGLIIRQNVTEDARLKKLLLTEKAKKIKQSIDQKSQEFEKILLKGLTEQEITNFVSTLHKIQNNLEQLSKEN